MVEPYYSDDYVTIYHGDCLELLPALSSVDLVLTSPPYNKGKGNPDASKEWNRLANGYGVCTDDLPYEQYVEWQTNVLELCWHTLTDDGAIYYQHKPMAIGPETKLPFFAPDHMLLRQIVTWDRGSGFQRNLTHYVPRYEWILIYAKENWRLNCRDVFDVWNIPPNADAEHPASFPLKLARLAVRTTDALTVLDPFAGSGTTLRAAKDVGRRAIGIEIEERYCEIAARRCAQEVLPLFDTEPQNSR